MANTKNTFSTQSRDELTKLLAEKREALQVFRFGMKGSRIRDTKEGLRLRRDIARILYRLGMIESGRITTE